MAYTKHVWKDKTRMKINAERLNNIENGIESAHKRLDGIETPDVPVVDKTLTQSGAAADAAVVGEKVAQLSEEIVEINGGPFEDELVGNGSVVSFASEVGKVLTIECDSDSGEEEIVAMHCGSNVLDLGGYTTSKRDHVTYDSGWLTVTQDTASESSTNYDIYWRISDYPIIKPSTRYRVVLDLSADTQLTGNATPQIWPATAMRTANEALNDVGHLYVNSANIGKTFYAVVNSKEDVSAPIYVAFARVKIPAGVAAVIKFRVAVEETDEEITSTTLVNNISDKAFTEYKGDRYTLTSQSEYRKDFVFALDGINNIGVSGGTATIHSRRIDLSRVQAGATEDEISAILSNARGTVIFAGGANFEIAKPIYVNGARNLVIDFNGCTFTAMEGFDGAMLPLYIGNNTMVAFDKCTNIIIKNGVFDGNSQSFEFPSSTCLALFDCEAAMYNCVFRNIATHHVHVVNGRVSGENLSFYDLGDVAGIADVYAHAGNNKRVETNWRGIYSHRKNRISEGQVFYFGVTDDRQDVYHVIDGIVAYNAGPIITLRGGEGHFSNIMGDHCGPILSTIVPESNITAANSPILTLKNVHLTNLHSTHAAAGIYLSACRRAYIDNVYIERAEEESNGVFRVIRLRSMYHKMDDIKIKNVGYAGITPWAGISVEDDVSCEIENVKVGKVSSHALYVVDYGNGQVIKTTPNTVKVINYDCNSRVVENSSEIPAKIIMRNDYLAAGTTENRPNPYPCETVMYYDTTEQKMMLWNGTAWAAM